MRSKKEIEAEIEVKGHRQSLVVELLLDIRELLTKKNKKDE